LGLLPDLGVWQRQVSVVPQLTPSAPPFHAQAVHAHGTPPRSQNDRSVVSGAAVSVPSPGAWSAHGALSDAHVVPPGDRTDLTPPPMATLTVAAELPMRTAHAIGPFETLPLADDTRTFSRAWFLASL
jgi:hypothetical protein